ncbi:amino acid adenylation domain-containing protein [Streptomyces anulatus]|uniref:amino acid adenylation domain-containing protein n=1 Tax=Streptomyces anulatus TaxID=1892 RepID=UPI00386A9A2D
MPPAHHALIVRLPPDAADAALAGALTTAAELWWPGERRPRLWTETVPAPAGSGTAARRRAAEARRPVAPGHRLRAVLLRYAGEHLADLVLTAGGAALDARSLRLVARVLRGDLAPDAVTPLDGPLPPDPRMDGETRRLASALAVTVGRYEGAASVRVAVPVPARDRPPYALGALDGYAVFTADLSPGRTVADLLATEPAAPAEGDDPPVLTLVAGDAGGDGDGPAMLLPTGPDALPVPAHQVRFVQEQLAGSAPNTPLSQLDPLSREESAEQLVFRTPRKAAAPLRIDEVFAAQVAARPDAPALTAGSATLSYAELDDRAEELADGLYARGVRPGDLVGLCLPRGADLVAAMLAALKADAVYVPLDPEHPADRRERTARDAKVRLTVDDPAALTGHPRRPAASRGPATGPAYVIHTSGSTGRPKGVLVPHTNVTALVDAVRDDFALSPDDAWTCFHSAAFDFSVWEIWGALLTGGRLVVVDHWTSRQPEDFHALLVRERVSVLSQTPSAFTQLAAADRTGGRLPALRLVVLGGEPLDARPLLGWFDRHPEDRCRLVNMYGITETTVHVTAATVTRREALAGSRSVGRPLPGWSVRVLDPHGRPVPPGAPGEIHVGGAGVALGYLHRPAPTAERFVPDVVDPAGRLYRSGDLGRLLPDGTLEHLGRIDDQVKVRGFRIEPGEIRHVLLEDPAVSAAAVTVTGGAGGDAAAVRIDAYVVPAPGAGEDPGSVRDRAARLLPPHMVPATVTVLPALPLTANGKLDPARLPAPGTRRTPAPAVPAAPAAPAADAPEAPAAVLAGIWRDVFGVEEIGPDDDFWDLGGNSLYAIRIGTLARERGLPGVALRQLYLTPTLGALSEALARGV